MTISYSMELKENNGIVNGYSITNINTHDETKSKISGIYFKEDKSFQLRETQVLSTKSNAPLNTFCYINMNLSFKEKLGSKRLEGVFTGNFLDNKECAKGKILLIEKNKINRKTKKLKKKIEKEIKKNQDTSSVKKSLVLKNGDHFTVNWESNNLKLLIWDANQEDGDKITLIINGNILLDNFKTNRKYKKIKYKLTDGENIIEIAAVNLGSSPPNTSRIELIDNKIKYTINTQIEIGEKAIIKIIK